MEYEFLIYTASRGDAMVFTPITSLLVRDLKIVEEL
jgi:hypothetical protein